MHTSTAEGDEMLALKENPGEADLHWLSKHRLNVNMKDTD
jgi:hypothetical protein